MPMALVDPTVPAQGGAGIPPSPLSAMMSNMVGAYGRQFPTAAERAQIAYHNALTQKTQQEIGSAGDLSATFQNAMNPQPVASTQEAPRPAPEFVGPEPGVTTSHMPSQEENLRANIPKLVGALAANGHINDLGSIARTMTYLLPGAAETAASTKPGTPSINDMASLGSGEAYSGTVGGMREHEALDTQRELAKITTQNQMGFTAEQKNRNANIKRIAETQHVDPQTAEGVVDGLYDISTDQAGNRVRINKATNKAELLYSVGQNALPYTTGGVSSPGEAPAAGSANPPAASPAAGAPKNNNPFNLRPVGATQGFQSYATPQEGLLAGLNDLNIKLSGQSKAMGGKPPTLRNIISTYSPPNENNTGALIQAAAARMGVNPDAPLNPTHLMPLAQAILAQEGNMGTGGNTTAAPTPNMAANPQPAAENSATPQANVAAAPTPNAGFKMNSGDLGLPFDTMYGGGAVAGRGMHTASAVFGDNTPDPALAAFGKLNALKNGLVSAMSVMPGRAANEGMQKRLLEAFPETDSNLLQEDAAMHQGSINPIDAETKFNQGIEESVAVRQQAAEALKNPYLDAKTRDAYQTVVHTVDTTLLKVLPPQKYGEYAKSVGLAPTGGAPAAPQHGASNLETLSGAVEVPAYEAVEGKPAISKADILETAQKYHMTPQMVVDKLREQGRVK